LTLGTQLETDSLKKSLNSQSSLGSCFFLAPQGDSQLIKWARDLPWTRWRSINTPHQVQGLANYFKLKTGAPNTGDVAPDALYRASGDPLTANCTLSDRAPDAPSLGPVAPSGVRVNLHPPGYGTGRSPTSPVLASGALVYCTPPWVWDRTLSGESSASVQCITLGTQSL